MNIWALLFCMLSVCSLPSLAADPGKLIRDIRPGSASSLGGTDSFLDPAGLVRFGEHVYFAANDGMSGAELWRTDGTREGTMLVADLLAGEDGSGPGNITVVDGKLFFTAFDNTRATGGRPTLFVLDGASDSITKLNPDIYVFGGLKPLGKKVCFSGDIFPGDPDGKSRIFCSDGSADGTQVAFNSYGPYYYGLGGTGGLTVHGGDLFYFGACKAEEQGGFCQNDKLLAAELLQPGACGSQLSGGINSLPSGLYFAACVNEGPPNGGVEPYIFTGGSVRKLGDLSAGLGSSPGPFFEFAATGQVFFGADGDESGLYAYVPATGSLTAFSTRDGSKPSHISDFFDFGSFFLFSTPGGRSTYRSDGTTAGTTQLDVALNAGSLLQLPGSDKALSNGFVITNGQVGGTSKLQTDLSGAQFVLLGDKVIFNGQDDLNGAEPRVASISEILTPRARFRPSGGAVELPEGGSSDISVDLSVVPDSTVSFGLAFTGTASDDDYQVSTNRLSFAVGEKTKIFTLTALSDTMSEPDETLSIRLVPDVTDAVGGQDVLPFVLKNVAATGTGGGTTPAPSTPTPTTPPASTPDSNSSQAGGVFSPALCLIFGWLLQRRLSGSTRETAVA